MQLIQVLKELETDMKELNAILTGKRIDVKYTPSSNVITFYQEDYVPGVWGAVQGLAIDEKPF